MEIRPLGGEKAKLHGVSSKLCALMRRLLALSDFHRIAALLTKMG